MSIKRDTAESAVNMIVGAIINYLAVMWLFGVSPVFAAGTTAVFFALSFVRALIIRRIFRRIENGR